jgi:DNA mismatch repair protein MutL
MVDRIGTLPTDVVHLMAAGEVIDSLAAVVRELSENAIDAGATRITVNVWAEQWRVQVADNGRGFSFADLQQAAAPHSTSKIKTCDDLWHITSLGFRGEALHSLAQLSNLVICSWAEDGDGGWRVQYRQNGHPLDWQPVAIAPGTVVTADQIFGTWIARRHGLPPMARQLRAIQQTVQNLALCHPHITWQVQQSDRPWFALSGGQTGRDILPQCLRDVSIIDLQEVQRSLDLSTVLNESTERSERTDLPSPPELARLSVLAGLPDRCHRHRPDWIKVAINGRIVQCPELEQTILGAFRRTLPRDRYPVCIAQLQIPPRYIDWNRHPAKSELYLHHLELWQTQLQGAIAQVFQQHPDAIADGFYQPRTGQLIKTAERGRAYRADQQSQPGTQPTQPLKAIAQVHQMYIVTEHPTGIWLVEQHIAHERVLYEQLCDRWQTIALEPPIILRDLTAAQVEQLERIHLTADPFGQGVWALRTAPAALAHRPDCAEALLELSQGGDLDAALVATACRTAIRNGIPLSPAEMQTLIDQWQATRHPHTCPHGRPICLSLEESSLSRFFRRHWVIGKSHGI